VVVLPPVTGGVVGAPVGRVSWGRVRRWVGLGAEPGGRSSGTAVRGVAAPGPRGGVPAGRRESRRPGGRAPGWRCCALFVTLLMTLFMGSPFGGPWHTGR
jgi:hypothetical protein